MIKVIVFDLGNVILPFDLSICCNRLARVSGFAPEEIYDIGLGNELIHNYEEGRLSSQEFYEAVCLRLKTKITYYDFCQMWNEIFIENEDVSALIRSLKENYRLLLLSNTNELHFNFARKTFSVLEEFEDYILSFRLGYAKPNPLIFQEAIRRANCKPEEIIYTDDIADYVTTAENLGIQGIHFRSSKQLKEDLAQRQVSWKE